MEINNTPKDVGFKGIKDFKMHFSFGHQHTSKMKDIKELRIFSDKDCFKDSRIFRSIQAWSSTHL